MAYQLTPTTELTWFGAKLICAEGRWANFEDVGEQDNYIPAYLISQQEAEGRLLSGAFTPVASGGNVCGYLINAD